MPRVPEFLMYNKSQEAVTNVRDAMMKNQEKAVTGKRVNKPSDDPVNAMRSVMLKTQLQRDEQVSQNLEIAGNIVNITDSTLAELSDVIARAKELAIQMSSTSNANDDVREAATKEIEQLRLRAIQLGNTRLGDRYIFGGYRTEAPPFDEGGNYFGDSGTFQIEVDKGQRLAVNLPGLYPFFGISDLPDQTVKEGDAEGENVGPQPNVAAGMRSPASLVAERRGLDIQDQDNQEEWKKLQGGTGVNVFFVLQNFNDALKAGDVKQVQGSLDGLDNAFKQVLQSRAMVGARQNAFRLSTEGVEISKETGLSLISNAEDADTLKVYSEISKNENSLKSALEINKKILTPSLLHFLD
jgi:flagellar hook-associated protein 3 FlgL